MSYDAVAEETFVLSSVKKMFGSAHSNGASISLSFILSRSSVVVLSSPPPPPIVRHLEDALSYMRMTVPPSFILSGLSVPVIILFAAVAPVSLFRVMRVPVVLARTMICPSLPAGIMSTLTSDALVRRTKGALPTVDRVALLPVAVSFVLFRSTYELS